MMDKQARQFASKDRALVVAAAGCGKTELIARSVALEHIGRQLVLTHTHAGVRALRERLKKVGALPKSYHVETIDGFALRYGASFPQTSCCPTIDPTKELNWAAIRESCKRALDNSHVKHVFTRSYVGFYVDEYQDCTVLQHELILKLAELLPCRIVGDPLQGIFGFDKNDPLANWDNDVLCHFDKLADLDMPYRWFGNGGNPKLGRWLSDARKILDGGTTSLVFDNDCPVHWVNMSSESSYAQIRECFKINQSIGRDTAVAIHNIPSQAHWIAKRLNGCFQSMEEVESRALMKFCKLIDNSTGYDRAHNLVNAVCECMTKIPQPLLNIKRSLKKGRLPTKVILSPEYSQLLDELCIVSSCNDYECVTNFLELLVKMQGVVLYRAELFNELRKTCRAHKQTSNLPLCNTAWNIREAARKVGRRLHRRLVSRTLLVKGLEFDHAIVLDADGISDKRNLYVALTRASKSLTVISKDRVLYKPKSPPM